MNEQDLELRAPVVVAVGPDGSTAAVRRGATEALRRGRGVHLVHATRVGAAARQGQAAEDDAGSCALAHARRIAEAELAGRFPVTAIASGGSVATVVSMVGDHAPVVVTGRRPRQGTEPWQQTSVGASIAAHVRAPVLSVPATDHRIGDGAPVVVGLDLLGGNDVLLREAFDAARATGGGVRLVTARWRPDRSGTPARSDDLDRELALLLERLRSDYPDVQADLRVSPAGAADSLLAASRSASLLVLGRHEPWVPRGSFLGPVARAVLRVATCPVLVSAPAPVHGARTLGAGAGPVTVG